MTKVLPAWVSLFIGLAILAPASGFVTFAQGRPHWVTCEKFLRARPADGVVSYKLSEWQIVEGDPSGQVVLAPNSTKRRGRSVTNHWDLIPHRLSRLYLRCIYVNANNTVSHIIGLPASIHRCDAFGTIESSGRVTLPMHVQCE
jgi:hypothetical protein